MPFGKGTFGCPITPREGKEIEASKLKKVWKNNVDFTCDKSPIHQVNMPSKIRSCSNSDSTLSTQIAQNQQETLFCAKCSLDFKLKEDLKVHMQNIHLRCQTCDEQFGDMCDLMDHELKVHCRDPSFCFYGFCICDKLTKKY